MPSFLADVARQERWRRLPGLERVAGERAVLTFDDGPDPHGTPRVLEALEAAGVRATFFLTGEQLMRNTRLAREITGRGHEVGLHGFEHRPHDELSPQRARDDIARALGTLEVASGRRPRFCRAPYGLFSEASHEACLHLGLEPVYWSAWGLDWETVGATRIAELVIRDLGAGSIVLLHDSARYAPREDVTATADAVGAIAAAARERELALVTLGEAVGAA